MTSTPQRLASLVLASVPLLLISVAGAQEQKPAPQQVDRPKYVFQRFNEDWSVLRHSSVRRLPDFWDGIKYIPLEQDLCVGALKLSNRGEQNRLRLIRPGQDGVESRTHHGLEGLAADQQGTRTDPRILRARRGQHQDPIVPHRFGSLRNIRVLGD